MRNLKKYILKRVFQTIIVLMGVTFVTFFLVNVLPGDPVSVMMEGRADKATIERIRHEMGLDKPLMNQYGDFLKNAVTGNFGASFSTKMDVKDMIRKSFVYTAKLGTCSLLWGASIGIFIGIISALNRGKVWDRILMGFAMLGISAPSFWIAIILQIILGLKIGIFPISGVDSVASFVLPTIALGSRYVASFSRITRTSMVEVLSNDYIRTSKAMGISEVKIVFKYALKNALSPIVTFLGLSVKGVLGGAVLIETVFSIPGIGRLMVSSVMARDIPLIQGCTIYIAFIFVVVNLIVDILYVFLDPQVKIS
ncbi:ABC transporter permease [Clostridium collagenovorans]|uniref:ABC transporter permease n=1 Tax=Clostridium collagenovorans TaxID=29357 RepID=UPI001FA8B7D7|nr:ABC transporter permease [Clostridium collagenovorans]